MKVEGSSFLVVGAGIAGLVVASQLQNAGATVTVVEKGRGVGGRMATRRMDGARIDHGAQFFTVRSTEFGEWVDRWLSDGVIGEWFRDAPWDAAGRSFPRYCGKSGMTDVAKALAGELEVIRSVRLISTRREDGRWQAVAGDGETFEADALILTAPVPQSMDLLRTSGVVLPHRDWERLEAIDYDRCLTGLFLLSGESGLDEPGAKKISDDCICWVGDNARKGISPDVPAVTVHSTPEFALEYWDEPDEKRMPLLVSAAERFLGAKVVGGSVHRWRYNTPKVLFGESSYWNEEFSLGFAGDAFGGARVEGAALSGLALAKALIG